MVQTRPEREHAMNFQLRPHLTTSERRLPFECVTLLLQGGGALGAYQGGVYEALAEANIHPDWIAGISIGAINGAIIAGNPPHSRVDRLREFWTQVTSSAPWDWSNNPFADLARSDHSRNLLMASGALPPGFPSVEIDGEQYWDGGLVSNTPLQWVVENDPRRKDTLAFQVDLWSAQGQPPRNMAEVTTRQKEIQFSAERERAPANSRTCTGSSAPWLPCCAGFLLILRRTT